MSSIVHVISRCHGKNYLKLFIRENDKTDLLILEATVKNENFLLINLAAMQIRNLINLLSYLISAIRWKKITTLPIKKLHLGLLQFVFLKKNVLAKTIQIKEKLDLCEVK